jgi:hypothetical protein
MKKSIFFEPMMATGNFILHLETDDVTSFMEDENQSLDTRTQKERK